MSRRTVNLRNSYDLANLFHYNTKISPARMRILSRRTFRLKVNRKMIEGMKTYKLSPKESLIDKSFPLVLKERMTTRIYEIRTPILFDIVSTLLHFSYGVSRFQDNYNYRFIASAGGIYPIEIYLVAFNVRGIEKGIYIYDEISNSIKLVKVGDFRRQFHESVSGMNKYYVDNCAFIIVSTINISSTCEKYDNRGYRFINIDVGHLSQNLYLVSSALSLGVVAIGGFIDEQLEQLLNLHDVEDGVALFHCFGKKQQAPIDALKLKLEDYYEK
ncbi:SagB/ThcOx family dehydrogenase [Paenibacillus sp. RS8]|uniref:SagB/ThcOx family dehydrogenase n=1 Tax=Paenibacillus sp. RS8 TaxID=3242681 RepID=UPI0035C1CEF1